ncbi:hypothetical protein L1987_32619 [Smallanthus sonchifolius]|uniref:Uncharacterized protein n=1 Tax=Smallanthus sonchifolius TaxID=185202 RepID=A0ACB9HN36_9ASTR|nr:hypothetical protein L1987_32619 [Smallanthus sonchifolius]
MDSNSAPSLFNSTIIYSNANGLQNPPIWSSASSAPSKNCASGASRRSISNVMCLHVRGRQIIQEEQVLMIKVKSGWKRGTKVTFEGMGN